MNQVLTVFNPSMTAPRVFSTTGAVKVVVSGLIGSDYISFLMVQEIAQNTNFTRIGCYVYEPTNAEIASATTYTIGECRPTATARRQTLYISDAGKFLPIIHGNESDGGLTITIEEIASRAFLAEELGILPCRGCVSQSWQWSGKERINGEKVEREYVSDCGDSQWREDRNIIWWETGVKRCENNLLEIQEQNELGHLRWKKTGQPCGYSPSIPVKIFDECGNCYVGYAYHPDEPRPPSANVPIQTCRTVGYDAENNEIVNEKIVMWIYPTATTGRTLAFEDCDGVIYGYLENRSDSAPIVGSCGCGCKE